MGSTPQPPAQAFVIMSQLLPAHYFTKPAPTEGVELFVTGHDNVVTVWQLSIDMARAVHPILNRRGARTRARHYRARRESESS